VKSIQKTIRDIRDKKKNKSLFFNIVTDTRIENSIELRENNIIKSQIK